MARLLIEIRCDRRDVALPNVGRIVADVTTPDDYTWHVETFRRSPYIVVEATADGAAAIIKRHDCPALGAGIGADDRLTLVTPWADGAPARRLPPAAGQEIALYPA